MTSPVKTVRYIVLFLVALLLLHLFISYSSYSLSVPSASGLASSFNPKTGTPGHLASADANQPQTSLFGKPLKQSDSKGDSQKPNAAPAGPKENATFVTLARNHDIYEVANSIHQIEDRFNRNYHYDWIFLNDDDFNDEFKEVTTALTSGTAHYGKIPQEHWSFPPWIDQNKAAEAREKMKGVIYGGSVSYRHMCRYESGFFFRHDLLKNYNYYWRIEPNVQYFCDIPEDPFTFMRTEKKKYGFVISLHEYKNTVPGLWNSVKKFMRENPEDLAKDNLMGFVSDDNGENYNMCHFWSNFEIGDLNFLRSPQYLRFFDSLDHDGGFFYERWGDAPVHSIAASLLLNKSEVYFFQNIGYKHPPLSHCPVDAKSRLGRRCRCDPRDNFDFRGYSCSNRWYNLTGHPKPEGWESQSD